MHKIRACIGIGVTGGQLLSFKVLEHSIRKTASDNVILDIIQLSRLVDSRFHENQLMQRTPFSLQRFLLAEHVCSNDYDYGIYLDSDMLLLGDISGLIIEFNRSNQNIETVSVKSEWNRREQTSVLVFDRGGASTLSDCFKKFCDGLISYDELMYLKNIEYGRGISWNWNSLEYLTSDTKLIHWTDVDTQPWLKKGNPNSGIWYSSLYDFINTTDDGLSILEQEVKLGHVLPSLLFLNVSGPSVTGTPLKYSLLDLFFIPPPRFQRIHSRFIRRALGPLFACYRWAHLAIRNGQINVR